MKKKPAKAKKPAPKIPVGMDYAVAKELAERSLYHFVIQAWPSVEPEKRFMDKNQF